MQDNNSLVIILCKFTVYTTTFHVWSHGFDYGMKKFYEFIEKICLLQKSGGYENKSKFWNLEKQGGGELEGGEVSSNTADSQGIL